MKRYVCTILCFVLFTFCCAGICSAAEYSVAIGNCRIGDDAATIEVTASASQIPSSDDGCFYLFECKTYEEQLGSRTDYAAWAYQGNQVTFQISLNLNQADSRLYSKFVVAVKKGNTYQIVSKPSYITNPEKVAAYTYDYPNAANKKGLLMAPEKLFDASDLGLSYATYNVPLYKLLGETTNADFPTISYTYQGKTYRLNGETVSMYDTIFKRLTSQNVIVTAILLNPYQTSVPELIHPLSRGYQSAIYYTFNAADAQGAETLEALTHFLAERYSREDKAYGQVMNWIVGNEVNICKEWNYMSDVGMEKYVEEYIKGFRIIYTAVKSQNANARVYTALDQRWNRTDETLNRYYNGKAFLDYFNQTIASTGNIDWSLSQHPYPIPLTLPKFWDMPAQYARMKLIQDNENTPVVSIANIKVLSDYLQKAEYLNPEGKVRHIMLSEVGFTSLIEGKEDLQTQAAAIAYAYRIAEANEYIDVFNLFRQEDTASEIAQGLALGLYTTGGVQKPAYQVYKYLGTSKEEETSAFAKQMIGISDWNQVIQQVEKPDEIGWNQDNTGWKYLKKDGTYVRDGWGMIDGKWYYFNEAGYMQTGWLSYQGKWYYLAANGEMLVNTVTPDGYQVDADGVYQ